MEKIKLKPCPFCGEKPKLYDVPEHGYQIALCECSCGSAFAGGKTTEEAAKNWNRRAPEWVSVDKVLPLNRMHVIGFDTESRWNYPSLYFCPDTKEFLDEMYDNKPVKITHWMPYPEAPEEDEEDE